jgi:threonine 3-dehydrogenase
MKALVKSQRAPGIWLENVPEPKVGHNDVKIRVRKTAICGTDIHIYNWDQWAQKTIPVPMHVGHEYVGEIVEIGSEVQGFKVGDRVSGEGHITCGYCRNCRAGRRHLCRNTVGVGVNGRAVRGLPRDPAFNAFKLPDSITDDVASILDPLGNATHTALSFNLVGEDVLITGAGRSASWRRDRAHRRRASHRRSPTSTTSGSSSRRRWAPRARSTWRTSRSTTTMKDLGMVEGFDVGLEMSGNPSAFRDLLRTMHHGGSVALLGIPPDNTAIDWNQVIFKGLVLKGIYGREMFETWYKMARCCRAASTSRRSSRTGCRSRVPRGLRDHEERSVGQGDPRLGRVEA